MSVATVPSARPAAGGDLRTLFLEPRPDAHLLSRIRRHFEPDAGELEALADLCSRSERFDTRSTIRRAGASASHVLIQLSGASHESFIDIEGRVQIFDFHFPGDVIGPTMPWRSTAGYNLRAASPCLIASVERTRFDDRISERLRRLFASWETVEHLTMRDRLRVVGRARASERIVHLTLSMGARQAHALPDPAGQIWFPFSQAEVGDALGLTNVYVSKTLATLRAKGQLRIDGDVARITNPDYAAEAVDFTDRWSVSG